MQNRAIRLRRLRCLFVPIRRHRRRVGQPPLRYGWVVTPAGQWLRLRPQQWVLDERWQVAQVRARSLTLTALAAEPDCPASQGDISLMMGNNKDGKP